MASVNWAAETATTDLRGCVFATLPELSGTVARMHAHPSSNEAWRVTWPQYMKRYDNGDDARQVGEKVGAHDSTVRRWRSAKARPEADAVIEFARHYERPRIEALIAAGYLTSEDVNNTEVIEIGSALADLTADELLTEISLRIRDRGPRTTGGKVDDVDSFLDGVSSPGGNGRLKKRGQGA